jgi:hypothetical protein
MPRRRSEPQAVVIPSTALVASATRYPGSAARIYQPRQDWQQECYRQYAICGEARFAAKFFGNAVSRAILNAAEMEEGTPHVQTSGPAHEALVDLFDGKDGPTQMLEAIGQHLTIAGECYLVGRTVENADVWEVVSCIELRVAGNNWQIDYGNGMPAVDLTEDDVVIRIWLPNPGRRIEADSPFKALLPILTEIEWLTRHVFAQVSSRLAGAGILMLPQGMTFPPAPAQDGQEVVAANDADAFMLTLAEAMMQPIKDPGSPSAIVPIVVTAPDDTIDKAKLLTFWSDLDANSLSLRSEAIRRFALGMDLPPEQVLGMSSNGGTGGGTSNGVSHWGAWQIEESTIKMHVEPMLDVIVNALTMGYLRPILGENSTAVVVYDTSRLRLRPDRSKEAFELYDRGLISAGALRRENGFDDDDIPSNQEFQTWLLVKVASGSTTPEQVNAALLALGVPLAVPPSSGTPSQAPPTPSLEEHPRRPRTPDESALVAASEALVFRALERAGNRLRQTGTRPPGVPSYETHLYVKANGSAEHLLDDAWSCAEKVLNGIADPAKVIPVLNSYCTSLLSEQSPHERPRLVNWLELSGEMVVA